MQDIETQLREAVARVTAKTGLQARASFEFSTFEYFTGPKPFTVAVEIGDDNKYGFGATIEEAELALYANLEARKQDRLAALQSEAAALGLTIAKQ